MKSAHLMLETFNFKKKKPNSIDLSFLFCLRNLMQSKPRHPYLQEIDFNHQKHPPPFILSLFFILYFGFYFIFLSF